jgi:demethoxyubiquinone hydroxylase (CLK1/Coq7/Cat5 family)
MKTVKARLIELLQNAHAGELAAYHAYDGHMKSVRDAEEKAEILKIRDEEWVHRECVAVLLRELDAAPRPRRELMMKCIGLTIGLLCRIGGWLIPMHGAGKLESGNVMEYVVAARLARDAGLPAFIEPLLHMAEVEWDHEIYFRRKTVSHRLHVLLPMWTPPPPRETIRAEFLLQRPEAAK